jgi:hypothetical protein
MINETIVPSNLLNEEAFWQETREIPNEIVQRNDSGKRGEPISLKDIR